MLSETERLLRDPGAELVFGLVATVGADLERFETDLVDQLDLYGYSTNSIRLSALLRSVQDLGVELKEAPELDRINSYMNAGNALRERSKAEEILALWAIARIRRMRPVGEPAVLVVHPPGAGAMEDQGTV